MLYTLVLVLCSIFLPPVAVLVKRGFGMEFLLNCLLTVLCFWVFGCVHALLIVLKDD